MSLGIFSSGISSKYSSSIRTSYGYRSVIPSKPFPLGSSEMTCSRDVNTTLPRATIPSCFIASRITAKRLLPDVAIGDNVVRAVQIEFVDRFLRHELIDLDRAFAFDRDRLEFLGIDLEVLVLTDLVAFDDVIGVDFFFGVGIDLAVFDPMTGLFVDLMEADFFALRGRGEERDRTRDQRQLEVALPIRAGCHD